MAETVTVGGVGRLHGVQCVSTGVDRGLEPELGAAPQARWLQDVPAYVTEVGMLSLCDRMCVCVCVCVCVCYGRGMGGKDNAMCISMRELVGSER